jgi:hypothetical protein
MFECKSYSDNDTYTNFDVVDNESYNSFGEAYFALTNRIIPELKESIEESYYDDPEIDVEIVSLDKAETAPFVATVNVYEGKYNDLVEENYYKIVPIAI